MVHKFSLSMCTLNVEELIWKVNKWDGAPCNIKITDISMWKNDCRLYVCALSQTTYVFNFAFNVQSTRASTHHDERARTYVGDIKFISRVTVLLTALSVSAHIDTHRNFLAKIFMNFEYFLKKSSRCIKIELS